MTTDVYKKLARHLDDLPYVVELAVRPMAEELLGVMSQLWNGGSRLRMVILGGGGAHLIADHVRQAFPSPDYPSDFVQVLGDPDGLRADLKELAGHVDPVYGNAEGMYRYALYRWRHGEQ